MKCSALPPYNEQCYNEQAPAQMEQCPRCLRVYCYSCIQQHDCERRPLTLLDLLEKQMRRDLAPLGGLGVAALSPLLKELRDALTKEEQS